VREVRKEKDGEEEIIPKRTETRNQRHREESTNQRKEKEGRASEGRGKRKERKEKEGTHGCTSARWVPKLSAAGKIVPI